MAIHCITSTPASEEAPDGIAERGYRIDMARDPVVAFYSGGPDDRGRTLASMLAWRDDELEAVHDFIQWMFPTAVPSGVNPFAPLVTDRTVAGFAARAELRQALRRSLDRMLSFYGLCRETERIRPDPSRFPDRSRVWLHPGNHNHLRLTRILQSLALLGLPDDARALQRCLLEIAEGPARARISPRTLDFWKRAVA